MSRVEPVTVVVTEDMAEMVRDAVATGEYASPAEIVREALQDWQETRELRHRHLERLRLLWREGLASGASSLADIDAVKAQARSRLDEATGRR